MDSSAAPSADFLQQSRVPLLVTVTAVFQLFSTLFVAARVYSRLYLLRIFKADDYILVGAWLLATGSSIVNFIVAHKGVGRHTAALPIDSLKPLLETLFISQILFVSVVPIAKMSICLCYRRIFYSQKTIRLLLEALTVYLTVTCVGLVLFSLLQCQPVAAFWDLDVLLNGGRCIDVRPSYFFNGISNILTDVFLIVVIIPPILRLSIPRRQRILLLVVVSLGWLAVAAAAVRLARTTPFVSAFFDLAWESALINTLTAIEVHISIICAAATSIKPVIAQLIPWVLGEEAPRKVSNNNDNNNNGNNDLEAGAELVSRSSSDINVFNGRSRSTISTARKLQRLTRLDSVSDMLAAWLTASKRRAAAEGGVSDAASGSTLVGGGGSSIRPGTSYTYKSNFA